MRYDKGVEQKLFETLSGRILEITAIFGTVPDFIVDQWVEDRLENKLWDEQDVADRDFGSAEESLRCEGEYRVAGCGLGQHDRDPE
jgi:hypothetical protein